MNATYTRTQLSSLRTTRSAPHPILPLCLGILSCSSVIAATLPVTSCADSGNGSLRAAVAAAHDGDIVDLSALTCGTISLATGEIDVSVGNLALQGPGAGKLTIAGSSTPWHTYSVVRHSGGGSLRVDSLRITDSHAHYAKSCIVSNGLVDLNASTVTECGGGAVSAGGGFKSQYSTMSSSYRGVKVAAGDVSIRNSTIAGNSGAICTGLLLGRKDSPGNGTVEISNTTISGNVAYYYSGGGGCIYQPATISSSTITSNSSAYGAGGLKIDTSRVSIDSSIVANSVGDSDLFVRGALTGHNNLIPKADAPALPADTLRADPLLLPLAYNGGPTPTHALAAASPAIDAGNNAARLVSDQRGGQFARVVGARADIGAFELQPAPPVSIGPGFTGAWFDPAQGGHGLMVEVLSDNRFYASWFAFDATGKQAWFTGVGTYSGNSATITQTVLPEGGHWIPNFKSADIVVVPWGTLTFTFSDCDTGRVDFVSTVPGFGSNSMNLKRLTQPLGLACP